MMMCETRGARQDITICTLLSLRLQRRLGSTQPVVIPERDGLQRMLQVGRVRWDAYTSFDELCLGLLLDEQCIRRAPP